WCGGLNVGDAKLARPRVEHRTRRYPLAGLVGFTARKHSCLVAPVVRSAPPMCSARPSWSPRSQLARLKKRPAIQVKAGSRMSHPYINDPKYWRERAEEARSRAKLLNDQEAKRQLFAIADRYYRLADHIKQRPNSQNSK